MKKKLFVATPLSGKNWYVKADSMKVEGGAAIFENAELQGNQYKVLVLSLSVWKNIYGFGETEDAAPPIPAP